MGKVVVYFASKSTGQASHYPLVWETVSRRLTASHAERLDSPSGVIERSKTCTKASERFVSLLGIEHPGHTNNGASCWVAPTVFKAMRLGVSKLMNWAGTAHFLRRSITTITGLRPIKKHTTPATQHSPLTTKCTAVGLPLTGNTQLRHSTPMAKK